MTSPPVDPAQRRNRLVLLGLFALFFVPIALAMLLNAAGMRPAPDRAKGELLQPPVDLRTTTLVLADGTAYPWNPVARTWRIVALAPTPCAAACSEAGRQLDVVWELFGKDADRADVLWLCPGPACTPPATTARIATLRTVRDTSALRALAPASTPAGGVPVLVVDPNGFVVLRYPAGFDPADLRSDMAKLLKTR